MAMELPSIRQDRNLLSPSEAGMALMPMQKREIRPVAADQKPVVDLWPAYASGNILGPEHLAVTKNISPPKLITVETTHQQITSRRKPRFLQELEAFVARELKAASLVKDDRARELKLQVYREVFEVLIEDFRAYRGLLAAIKNEYELMIAYLRQRIRDLEPLQQLMTTQTAQCEQKLLEMEQAENEEIEHLKAENKRLRQRIANFKQDELAWQEQIRKMGEDLNIQYQKYRDECDARKMLISDINDLRYQQEEAQLAAIQASKSKGEGLEADTELMKIALKEAKKAEAEATRKLDKMVADYADVIPRRDYERLLKDHDSAKTQLESTTKDFTTLHNDHKQLLETYKELKSEAKTLAKEYEEHKGNSTPRPKWEKAAAVIYGGAPKWQQISEGKSSDQLVDVLIEEFKKSGGALEESAPSFFTALGMDSAVPIYLRCNGKIRNRRLGRRDLLFTINDIWRERIDAGPEARRSRTLAEFFFDHLKHRFSHSDTMLYEWGYNVHMACQRHHDDDRVRLFFNVLTGQMDEEMYHYQRTVFQKMLAKLDSADSASEGALTVDAVRWSLAELFPDKSDQRLDNLIRVAKLQLDWQEGEKIAYRELFAQDDEGGAGVFLDEVKDQITAEQVEYVDQIMQNTGGKALIETSSLFDAVRAVDPQISDTHARRYVCWAFSCSPNDLATSPVLSANDIRDRLLNGCVYKVGRALSAM